MVLIIVLAAVFGFMFLVRKGPRISVKRCWDAPPGESKVHTWVLREEEPGSKRIVLICKICGQSPGGE